jgi:hypothetical protein
MIPAMPKEIEDAVLRAGDIPGVVNVRLSAAWEHYRHLRPQAMAGLAPPTGSNQEDKVSQLLSLDPALMSDSEHVEHFGFSRRDEAIEEGVRARLRNPAPKPTLTEADLKVCAQLGVSVGDFKRTRLEERTETPTAPKPETFTLTAQDRAICVATGVSEADFMRVRTEERVTDLEGTRDGKLVARSLAK